MSIHQKNYVSNKMRSLDDLVLRIKKIYPSVESLHECLNPTNFDKLCTAVKMWNEYDENTGICGVTSVPMRICKSIKSCSQIILSEAIKNKSLSVDVLVQIRNRHEQFMSLMVTDWAMEISGTQKAL